MNWRHETWRKLFIREEGSFAALSYSARSAAAMLLKLCDDRGKIYARAREDVVESVCFRLGADRGERRMLREAIADLLRDGYLAQGEGWLRIKNFHAAQGRSDLEPDANEVRTGPDDVVTRIPMGSESPTNETRTGSEPVANASPMSTEECVKTVELFSTAQTVPSVPLLPSDPSPEAPNTPAREGARVGRCTGFDLISWYGIERADSLDGACAWKTPSTSEGKAYTFAEDLTPDEVRDVRPTMRLHFADLKAGRGKNGALENPTFGFGCWMSEFTALRERLHGKTPARVESEADRPCDHHSRGQNRGKPAPKHDFRKSCGECRRTSGTARASPAAPGEPATAGDVLAELRR